jgi:hypothetical protein
LARDNLIPIARDTLISSSSPAARLAIPWLHLHTCVRQRANTGAGKCRVLGPPITLSLPFRGSDRLESTRPALAFPCAWIRTLEVPLLSRLVRTTDSVTHSRVERFRFRSAAQGVSADVGEGNVGLRRRVHYVYMYVVPQDVQKWSTHWRVSSCFKRPFIALSILTYTAILSLRSYPSQVFLFPLVFISSLRFRCFPPFLNFAVTKVRNKCQVRPETTTMLAWPGKPCLTTRQEFLALPFPSKYPPPNHVVHTWGINYVGQEI